MTLSIDSQLKGDFLMSATSATIAWLDGHQDLAVLNRTADVTTSEEAEVNALEAIYYPITQRDPNDVRTILRLAVSALAFAALSLALAGLLTYKLTRNASLVVVERTAEG